MATAEQCLAELEVAKLTIEVERLRVQAGTIMALEQIALVLTVATPLHPSVTFMGAAGAVPGGLAHPRRRGGHGRRPGQGGRPGPARLPVLAFPRRADL
jgi:hypothetical protein